MSVFFFLNNLHFSLEIFGAIAFLMVAWLSLDSFLVRKDFLTASRGIGFGLLAVGQVFHALDFSGGTAFFLGHSFYLVGAIFALWNLFLEAPSPRPEFKAVLVLPAASTFIIPFNSIVTLIFFLITWLSFRQYKHELKKIIGLFSFGFLFLSLGALFSIFHKPGSIGILWQIGHFFELVGFLAIGWWVWKYLALRVREEMLLIFVSVTLFMAVIVSLTFSTILLSRVEAETNSNLITDAKVLGLTLVHLKEEARAKAELFSKDRDVGEALAEGNFIRLERFATEYFEENEIGFLTIIDNEGFAVVRAHALSSKGDNLLGERGVDEAFDGRPFALLESSPAEGFSVRGASPISLDGEIVGVAIAGFLLDNAFVDSIKKITGLEISIFENTTRVATTALNPDGRTRSVGIEVAGSEIFNSVFTRKEAITLRTEIASRPVLASYLPLLDNNSNVVGMLEAAKPQQEILDTAQATNRLTLIVVMVLMLILITPIYIVTRRLGEEIH